MENTALTYSLTHQLKLAIQGEPYAQHIVGESYLRGRETDINLSKALRWLERCVTNPNSCKIVRKRSLYFIATIYEEQNNPLAIKYYMRSARMGHASSMLKMGHVRHFGDQFSNDLGKAVFWYERAFKKRQCKALYWLGLIYSDRNFKGYDLKKAWRFFREASDSGCKFSWLKLGFLAESEDSIPATETQIARCYHKSVELGHIEAIGYLGWYYMSIRNYQKAYHWLSVGTEKGDEWSQYGLANMYRHGYWVEKSFPKAIEFYREIALKGNAFAQDDISQIYLALEDYQNAYRWCSRAARQGQKEAQYNLGILYMSGKSVAPNPKESTRWFKEAGKQEHGKAQFNTGLAYLQGDGIKPCIETSKHWFYKAHSNGVAIPFSVLNELGVDTPNQLLNSDDLLANQRPSNDETIH